MEKNKIEITKNKNGTIRASIMFTMDETSVPMISFDFGLAEFFQYSKEEDDVIQVNKYSLITKDTDDYLNAELLETIAKIARYLDWENVEIDGYEICLLYTSYKIW